MNRPMVGLLLSLFALALLVAGIAGMGLLGPSVYTADDNGSNITVTSGDTFLVKLPENPSTGYAWDISLSDGLAKLSDTYEPADRSGMKVGVGGTHTWEIKATKNGTQMVRGTYKGPGNQSAGAAETYALDVNVVQGGLLSGLFRMPAMLDPGARDTGQPQASVIRSLIRPGDNTSIMPAWHPVYDMPRFPMMQPGTSGPLLPAAVNGPPRDIKVTHTDVPPADETVTARVGDTIKLQLSQNPSTGYSWQMTASDGLEAVSDRSLGSMAPPNVVGAPAMHEWVYEVTKPGLQRITCVYKRPWEAISEGEKTYILIVDAV